MDETLKDWDSNNSENDIEEKWATLKDTVYQTARDLSEEAKEALVQRPVVSSLDEPPNFDELMPAITTTRDGKAPGMGGIPAEVWKFGGVQLTNCLRKLIQEIWDAQKVPQDWKDASIVPLFKKGDRKDCGNYQAMLEVAFKEISEGVYIQTRKEADLFNVAQFKAKNKTSIKTVR
ncbi:uncharacterized protein [Montipora foliosa]|uniref:uncharacterized protein n=1 Tax=Montipora foliosa TaxID=591990 RepID=UPI0035F1C7AD